MQCGEQPAWKNRGGRTCFDEPTLAEALADPLVRAVMDADGVDPKKLETLFASVAQAL
jgi:hypothetical protein